MTAAIVTRATSRPIKRLPPSPMKMRQGLARLRGRKPKHAPATAKASGVSAVSPAISVSVPAPIAETAATEAAAPSMLSIRLNAFMTPTTQTIVSARSAASSWNRPQPRPVDHSSTAMPTSTKMRPAIGTLKRSSTVPSTQTQTARTMISGWAAGPPSTEATAARIPTMIAVPPRYGVGRACPLYPSGRSKNFARTATAIATGVATYVTTAAIANAAAALSSGDIGCRDLRAHHLLAPALVLDHVVDRIVDGPARLPPG